MLLETEGLTKNFGNLTAVNRLDFRVEEGELGSIIGPNGAGKTTLFNLITGKLRPSGGVIRFKGKEITGLPPHAIARRGLARSFQLTNIFPNLTVFENVRIAVQAKTPRLSYFAQVTSLARLNEKTEELLERIGLLQHRDELAQNLSYGDQRHLEIGIALAIEPDLLLLDEPTSGMSPFETQATIRLIKQLSQDLTILLIEHDMDLVMAVSDSIMVMHYGEKIAEGTPEEVASEARVQEAYLGGI
ncbi:MAG: ABC transporter ATP-binding protein [Candidatus Bipolaricaulia bacterium]